MTPRELSLETQAFCPAAYDHIPGLGPAVGSGAGNGTCSMSTDGPVYTEHQCAADVENVELRATFAAGTAYVAALNNSPADDMSCIGLKLEGWVSCGLSDDINDTSNVVSVEDKLPPFSLGPGTQSGVIELQCPADAPYPRTAGAKVTYLETLAMTDTPPEVTPPPPPEMPEPTLVKLELSPEENRTQSFDGTTFTLEPSLWAGGDNYAQVAITWDTEAGRTLQIVQGSLSGTCFRDGREDQPVVPFSAEIEPGEFWPRELASFMCPDNNSVGWAEASIWVLPLQ